MHAAALRYKDHDAFYGFEQVNEPNLKKMPNNCTADAALIVAIGKAIRSDPATAKVRLVAPALAQHGDELYTWLDEFFASPGQPLQYIDVVTQHLYQSTPPEHVEEELHSLQALVDSHWHGEGEAPRVASGEWGYTTCDFGSCWHPVSNETQSKYIAREWLYLHALGSPLNVWYDWHRDCTDPTDRECRFGIVTHADFQPLTSYRSAVAALRQLGPYSRPSILNVSTPTAPGVALRYPPLEGKQQPAFAAWMPVNSNETLPSAPSVQLQGAVGKYLLLSYTGGPLGAVIAGPCGGAEGLGGKVDREGLGVRGGVTAVRQGDSAGVQGVQCVTVQLSDAPLYVMPAGV